ncbi:MAG: methyltransferase domain-containing protein [Caldilineales bacterium]|nr:methyltransferase domain-containing protein [Caldilineales bacterium]
MSESLNPYHPLPRPAMQRGRQALVLERSRGKRVLHVGCVDAGLLHERFARGELMHQKLSAVASELWGVDVDAAGIAFLQEQGFGNLLAGDICEPETLRQLRDRPFDLIIASEVVEHLANPGAFLESARQIMRPGHTELIVTVPNAFKVEALLWMLRGVELVHPDHNYWFSYHNDNTLIAKIRKQLGEVYPYSLQRWGWRGQGQAAAPSGGGGTVSSSPARGLPFARALGYARSLPKRLLVSWLYRRSPFFGDGLIVVATVPESWPSQPAG